MATPTERLRAWLDAGREIEERATKGPWLLKHPKMKFFENYIIANYDYCDEEPFVLAEPNRHMENWEQDVQFITDARTRVRVQREVIEELLKALNIDRDYYKAKPHKTPEVWDAIDEALDRAARLMEGKL